MPTFEGQTMRASIAMILGVIGAFLVVTGAIGGGTRLRYSGLGFYAPVVHSLGPRAVMITIGVLLPALFIYLLERKASPSPTTSPRSRTAISGSGLSSFAIASVILLALILANGASSSAKHAVAYGATRPDRHAAAVVKRYIAAINLRDYAEAWTAVGGKNTGAPYARFVNGFAATAYDRLTIKSVSANIVTIRLVAHQTDCTVKTYQGRYTVEDSVITHSSVQQVGTVTSSHADPAATVREFIAAINRRDYAEAWAVGGKNVGISYSKFVDGFAATVYDRLTIRSVSDSVVNIRLVAHQTDGTVKTYRGEYTAENCILTQFNIRQIR